MPDPEISGYHAHVYFPANRADEARRLRTSVAEAHDVTLGRFNDRLVGPHRSWSYEIGFSPTLFGDLVPWLMLHRGALTVFIHPVSSAGDRVDHTAHAMWLGERQPLDLDALQT